jgi:hypothetical protein
MALIVQVNASLVQHTLRLSLTSCQAAENQLEVHICFFEGSLQFTQAS